MGHRDGYHRDMERWLNPRNVVLGLLAGEPVLRADTYYVPCACGAMMWTGHRHPSQPCGDRDGLTADDFNIGAYVQAGLRALHEP